LHLYYQLNNLVQTSDATTLTIWDLKKNNLRLEIKKGIEYI